MADAGLNLDVSSTPNHLAESTDAERSGPIKTTQTTVVIATYDLKRWPQLTRAVNSILAEENLPDNVIVSVDHNRELYEKIREEWPELTVVLNSEQHGVSCTRNTGTRSIKTPFIVFIDDDIHVYPGWLPRLIEPFADPTVVGTGGGVVAGWETGRPRWFPAEFNWVVSASYRGMPTSRTEIRNVWAENMAVRTAVFEAVGGFRLDFGKIGDHSTPEDTDLCIRMGATSPTARWIYVPDAVVEHHVPAVRAQWSYFLRRNYQEGLGKVKMARLLGRQEKLQSERDYVSKTLPSGIASGLWATVRHGDVGGLLRSAAIVVGAVCAAMGALSGKVRRT